jgi:hypothetical protein
MKNDAEQLLQIPDMNKERDYDVILSGTQKHNIVKMWNKKELTSLMKRRELTKTLTPS